MILKKEVFFACGFIVENENECVCVCARPRVYVCLRASEESAILSSLYRSDEMKDYQLKVTKKLNRKKIANK